MVFKKDLTPIGGKRGVVTKHRGKGAAEHRSDPFARVTNRYPKPEPASAPPAEPMPVTQGMTPPFGIGQPPDEEV